MNSSHLVRASIHQTESTAIKGTAVKHRSMCSTDFPGPNPSKTHRKPIWNVFIRSVQFSCLCHSPFTNDKKCTKSFASATKYHKLGTQPQRQLHEWKRSSAKSMARTKRYSIFPLSFFLPFFLPVLFSQINEATLNECHRTGCETPETELWRRVAVYLTWISITFAFPDKHPLDWMGPMMIALEMLRKSMAAKLIEISSTFLYDQFLMGKIYAIVFSSGVSFRISDDKCLSSSSYLRMFVVGPSMTIRDCGAHNRPKLSQMTLTRRPESPAEISLVARIKKSKFTFWTIWKLNLSNSRKYHITAHWAFVTPLTVFHLSFGSEWGIVQVFPMKLASRSVCVIDSLDEEWATMTGMRII